MLEEMKVAFQRYENRNIVFSLSKMLEEMSVLEYNQHTLSPERECPEKITSGSTNPPAPKVSGGESHVSYMSLIKYVIIPLIDF